MLQSKMIEDLKIEQLRERLTSELHEAREQIELAKETEKRFGKHYPKLLALHKYKEDFCNELLQIIE